MRYKITFIGCGNVAWNLAHALDKYGHTIIQVIGRSEDNAKELARKFGAFHGTKYTDLYGDSDLIFISVNDDSYEQVLAGLSNIDAILIHTSGPQTIDILANSAQRYGVFYPLQSLNKAILKDFREVPLLVEGSSPSVEIALRDLADSISNYVKEVNSADRMRYHLAAVFANNFTNLMYSCSEQYLQKQGLDFNLLKPIIYETALRIKDESPQNLQTGPAMRKDVKIIEKHLEMIEDPRLKEVYQSLSNLIMTFY